MGSGTLLLIIVHDQSSLQPEEPIVRTDQSQSRKKNIEIVKGPSEHWYQLQILVNH